MYIPKDIKNIIINYKTQLKYQDCINQLKTEIDLIEEVNNNMYGSFNVSYYEYKKFLKLYVKTYEKDKYKKIKFLHMINYKCICCNMSVDQDDPDSHKC